MTNPLYELICAPQSLERLQEEGSGDKLVTKAGDSFPIVDGVPVLLSSRSERALGPSESAAREAAYYDSIGSGYFQEMRDHLLGILDSCTDVEPGRVVDSEGWIDSAFECSAQEHAYKHLDPLSGATVLQVGGSGLHAVKFLIAGAHRSVSITPFLQEAKLALELARHCGVEDRFLAVVGVGEELPFFDSVFDRLYSGASLHHLDCGSAFAEFSRVLRPDGRFSAIDPWRTAVYGIGTRVFGKREKDVNCRPLDDERLSTLGEHFEDSEVRRFHPVMRYPLILADRAPAGLSQDSTKRILRAETRFESRLPKALRGRGSSVAVLGSRPRAHNEALEASP